MFVTEIVHDGNDAIDKLQRTSWEIVQRLYLTLYQLGNIKQKMWRTQSYMYGYSLTVRCSAHSKTWTNKRKVAKSIINTANDEDADGGYNDQVFEKPVASW